MTSYNIFIKGINPKHLEDAELIVQRASQLLQIDPQKLTQLLNSPGSNCLYQGLSEEEAITCQVNLAKLGIVALYKPGQSSAGLSLAAIEEAETEVFTCPVCEHQTPLFSEGAPAKHCAQCGFDIEKYSQIQKEKQEREEIRANLMRARAAKTHFATKQKQEEAERKRKEMLEQEVLDHLGHPGKKGPNIKGLAIGTAFTLIAGSVGYFGSEFLFKSDNPAETSIASAKTGAADGKHAAGNSKANPQVADGQEALQQTYDRAEKTLNAFGLSSEGFAGNATGGDNTELAANAEQTSPNELAAAAPLDTRFINSANTQTWDLFLSKTVNRLTSAKELSKAQALSNYISDTETYVDAISQILIAAKNQQHLDVAKPLLAEFEKRLTTLPESQQVRFLAQAGGAQSYATGAKSFFERANKLWSGIAAPENRLEAALKIGLYNYKAGNIDVANRYFQQVNELIEKIQAPEQQLLLRAAVAKTYKDVDNSVLAEQWLTSANSLAGSSKPPRELIEAYAYINKAANAVALIKQRNTPDESDELSYHSLRAGLKAGNTSSAAELIPSIQQPLYKILAHAVNSLYDANAEASLSAAVDEALPQIQDSAQKAIVKSLLAKHYMWSAKPAKAKELAQQALEESNSIPASPTKDAVIAIIVKNEAYAQQLEAAKEVLPNIQDMVLKSELDKELVELAAVGKFL